MRTLYRKLQVWSKGHSLTLEMYRATERFPKHEQFGLTSQIRRAAASVPTNLVEGCGRESRADKLRFFQIAMGSAFETEYLVLLATDLGYLAPETSVSLSESISEIKAMLTALLRRMRRDD